MIRKKTLCILLAALCAVSACAISACRRGAEGGSDAQTSAPERMEYGDKLFDTSRVHTIDISIAPKVWEDLTANPLAKTKYETYVTIDGETIERVSFAVKGSTSLLAVAGDEDSDRYSFKLNFGKFIKGQTYYGLNKLNLNNLYADATYMKDYISYELFRRAGAEAPLVSYVWLTVNGADHGLYIAIEDISESYLKRLHGGEGVLYKPETEQLENMDNDHKLDGDGPAPQFGTPDPNPAAPPPPDAAFPGGQGAPGGPGAPGDKIPGDQGGPASNAKGADLVYSDDDAGSYPDIFENNETDSDAAAESRVIAALKALAERRQLDLYLDTEEVIRYFAAHNFVLNYDSYTGNMLHNYYLYENGGRLSMLPWDYNLAFGAFAAAQVTGGHGAEALVNTGIDTPLSGDESGRPMWSWIVSDGRYLDRYHAVFDGLISSYFESGLFEEQFDALYEMLLPYVQRDPSAFYTADRFSAAAAMLRRFCLLRAASIRAQLEGKLAASTDEQIKADRIDASGIDIAVMGTHSGGNGAPGSRPEDPHGELPGGTVPGEPPATKAP